MPLIDLFIALAFLIDHNFVLFHKQEDMKSQAYFSDTAHLLRSAAEQ